MTHAIVSDNYRIFVIEAVYTLHQIEWLVALVEQPHVPNFPILPNIANTVILFWDWRTALNFIFVTRLVLDDA